MDTQFTQRPGNNSEDLIFTETAPVSAVAWCAIFAGAVASAALSLILLFLGTGFGLTLVSPWSSEGISTTSFGITSILGVTVISLLASAIGGYLAGRLRTRWTNTPKDEVFFRDTAHGFLSWSVATLGTAALLTTVVGGIIGGGVKAGAAVAEGAGNMVGGAALMMHGNEDKNPQANSPLPYLLDSLLRKTNVSSNNVSSNNASSNDSASVAPVNPEMPSTNPAVTKPVSPTPPVSNQSNARFTAQNKMSNAELARIFVHAIKTGSLPESDLKYAAQLVAQHTRVDQQTAERRVTETFIKLQTTLQETEKNVKEAADKARKVSAYTSLWLFISLLSGAFIASLMAVYGGRQRDL